jgi:hypothetical protein
MNADLAYWSWWIWFKSLYDQGYLKIFNRVGWYRHPNDHDAAAKQISSYDSEYLAIWLRGNSRAPILSLSDQRHQMSIGQDIISISEEMSYSQILWITQYKIICKLWWILT